MTQEFHISVTPIRENEYLVRTERVAPGVPLAEEQITWPVEEWLKQAGNLMNDPLQGLLRGGTLPSLPDFGNLADNSVAIDSPSASLVAFGQQLYNALFQNSIRDSWMTARGIAHHRQETLRLRLGLKDTRLPRLPWEVMHDSDRAISTGTDVVFSRYHSRVAAMTSSLTSQQVPMIALRPPLRILMVLAAPTDQAVLALKQEALHLQEELQQPRRNGSSGSQPADIELTILEQPGREQLTQALEQNHYQVFHYAGHSNLGTAGGHLCLVSNKTGLTETLNGDDLAGLLVNNGIRMAVFNSCRSSYTSTTEGANLQEGNLVEALVTRGIPAVLAMAERIPDDVALSLSRLFYRNLKQAYAIDLSLNRARQGLIASYTSNQLYWALPILYLHPEFDGYLIQPRQNGRDRLTGNAIDDANTTTQASQTRSTTPSQPDFLTNQSADPFSMEEFEDYYYNNDLPEPQDLGEGSDYETDSEAIAQLIDQLSQCPTNLEENLLPAPLGENLLPELEAESKPNYVTLPENPSYPSSPSPQAPHPSHHNNRQSNSAATSISVAPKNTEMYSGLEKMLADAGKLTEAVADCIRAIQINPSDAEALHRLGLALHQQGYLTEAIAAYHQSINLAPRIAAVHNHLGLAFYEQGNLPQAVAEFNYAIELNPNLAEAYQNLGITLRKQTSVISQESASIQPTSQAPIGQRNSLSLDRNGSASATVLEPVSAVRSPTSLGQSGWLSQFIRSPLLWIGIGAIGLAGLFMGGWWLRDAITRPAIDVRMSESYPDTKNLDDLSRLSTNVVASMATEYLSQSKIPTAARAIETLLERGALVEVAAILPPALSRQPENSTLNFLMGRLAWQFIRVGNKDYGLDDVRRYWEVAAKQQSSPSIQNALGFAYYEEGNFDRAGRAWYRALELLGEPGSAPKGADRIQSSTSPAALTAYAGIALTLVKSSANQPPSRRATLLNEAATLRQKILTGAPSEFQADALGKNWLWSQKAVKDWQALLAMQKS